MRMFFNTILILLLMISSSSFAQKGGWKDMTLLDGREMYIDTTSIVRDGAEVTVWVKEVFTGVQARDAHLAKVEKAMRLNPSDSKSWDKKWSKKYADFYYLISKWSYDCVGSQYQVLEVIAYDSHDKKIARIKTKKEKAKWMTIDSKTIGDIFMFEVCDN